MKRIRVMGRTAESGVFDVADGDIRSLEDAVCDGRALHIVCHKKRMRVTIAPGETFALIVFSDSVEEIEAEEERQRNELKESCPVCSGKKSTTH